jgi:septum formation protein
MPSHNEEATVHVIPEDVVMELAENKAAEIAETVDGGVVIGADTIVVCGQDILGKPKSSQDAVRMLSLIQGREHRVFTAVSLIEKQRGVYRKKTFFECARVWVSSMSEKEICQYAETGEPMDKAGAYGVQGRFGVFIRKVTGEYNTIVGLPIARLYQEMHAFVPFLFMD